MRCVVTLYTIYCVNFQHGSQPWSDGVVGYHVRLTRERSPVRTWVRPMLFPTPKFYSNSFPPYSLRSQIHLRPITTGSYAARPGPSHGIGATNTYLGTYTLPVAARCIRNCRCVLFPHGTPMAGIPEDKLITQICLGQSPIFTSMEASGCGEACCRIRGAARSGECFLAI